MAETTEPFVKFTLSFEGPTIKRHAITLVVFEREHAPRACDALRSLMRSAGKSFAMVLEGIPLKTGDGEEMSEEHFDKIQAAFKKYNVDALR